MKKDAIAAKKEEVLGDALANEYEVLGVTSEGCDKLAEFVDRDNALGFIYSCVKKGHPYLRLFYRRIHEFGVG